MKKNLLFALLFVGLVWTSCSNDFDVTAPWKDIPIVYGLLNIQDTAHYIRVEKAFLDPKANALELAKIPDSLYYENAIVKLERVSTGQTFTLQKVDGKKEGYPRDSGVFATVPNWLYKIDSAILLLKPEENIRLIIDRGNGLPEVTGETLILDKGKQRSPGANDGKFRFQYFLPTKVGWSSSPEARIFDVKLVIHYAEYFVDNPAGFENKTLNWVWGRGVRFDNVSNEYDLERMGVDFYKILQGNLVVNPNIRRIFNGIDIIIIAGGSSLEKYINVALSNTGITGSQELPTYTNLSEGRGVFSSLNLLLTKNVLLTSDSRDSLKNGIYTKTLNFQ